MIKNTILLISLLLIISPFFGVGGKTNDTLSPTATLSDSPIPVPVSLDFPEYDIPLPVEIQQFIWEKAEEHDLSYELILAVIYVESKFEIDVVGVTGDLGLMQLNPRTTIPWLAEEVGIEDFDPMNPYHNITAGTWYLAYLRDLWLRQGYSHEQVFGLTLLGYNRGPTGARNYVRRYGLNNSYIDKVLAFKVTLEAKVD